MAGPGYSVLSCPKPGWDGTGRGTDLCGMGPDPYGMGRDGMGCGTRLDRGTGRGTDLHGTGPDLRGTGRPVPAPRSAYGSMLEPDIQAHICIPDMLPDVAEYYQLV